MAVVQGALAALPVRAGEAGTGGAALEDRVRAGLQERIDALARPRSPHEERRASGL
jgi:hypothetical protein